MEEGTAYLHGSEIRATQRVPAFAAYVVIAVVVADDPAFDDPFRNQDPDRPGDTC